jgi:WD40 repeat protein
MEEEEAFEEPDLDALKDATIFQDPFAPKVRVICPNGVFPAYSFLKAKRICNRPRPFVQHFFRANSQITAIKRYPLADSIVAGTLNAIYAISGLAKCEVSVMFSAEETHVIDHLDVHPSEVFVACNGPVHNVRIASLATGSVLFEGNSHRAHVTSLFFAPSFNKICSAGLDGVFIMSDLVARKQCFAYETKPISTAAVRHDEKIVAFGCAQGRIRLFDSRQVNEMISLKAHSSWINHIDFSIGDSYFSTCGIDRAVKIWDVWNLSEAVYMDTSLEYCLKKVLFVEDGTFFGVGSDSIITRWSLTEGKMISPLKARQCGIVTSEICIGTKKLIFSGQDMVLSALNY